MEQHPVPQNVTSFQFRLVGDMTIKQFGYLAGGAILAYIAFKLPLPFFFTWPLAALLGLGGFGFAFIPIEERPMDVWFLSFIKNVYSPTQFLWQKAAPTKIQEVTAVTSPADALSHNPLNALIGKLLDKFLPVPAPKSGTAAKGSVPSSVPPQQAQPIQQPFPVTPAIRQAPQPAQQPGFALKPVIPAPSPTTTQKPVPQQASAKPKKPAFSLTSFLGKFTLKLPTFTMPTGQTTREHLAHSDTRPMPVTPSIPLPKINTTVLAKGPAHALDWLFDLFRPKQAPAVIPATATSFTFPNTLRASTPVTGKHLDMGDASTPKPEQKPSAAEEQKQKEAQSKANELEDQVKKLTSELQTKQVSDSRVLELQKQLMEALEHKNKMEQELVTLRQQLTQKKEQPITYRQASVSMQPTEEKATVKVITPDMAVRAGLPRLTTFPNVITGIIKDNQGNLIPGILVTVKDKEEIPVRALKTNKLGQFAASTPLANGVYTVDIEDPKTNHHFDRVRVTLNGSILSPVEIIARTKKEMDRAKLAAEIFG